MNLCEWQWKKADCMCESGHILTLMYSCLICHKKKYILILSVRELKHLRPVGTFLEGLNVLLSQMV